MMLRAFALCLLFALPAHADVATVVRDQILPGYKAFAAATETLAATESCDPDVLRPAFQDAFDAWLQVAHLRFGPAEKDGRSLAIAFWPDPKGLGAKAQRALLSGDPAHLKPPAFAQQSVAARGLFALERLLYPVDALPADPCALIRATATDLARMAAEIDGDWAAFGQTLITAGAAGNTTFLTQGEARQELFTQVIGGLEFVADVRLARPMGTFDKPAPRLAEARASGRSLRNVQVSLTALKSLAVGLAPEIPQTTAAFDHVVGLAEKLDDPVFDAVATPQGRLRVEILQQAVEATIDAAVAELAPALGVTRGFNAADGD